MSSTRKNLALGSAALLTVSLAVCFGAAAQAVPVPAPLPSRGVDVGERVALTHRQRHALANLYAQLTDAARQLQRAPHMAAAPATPRGAAFEPAEPEALVRPLDRPHSLPTPPLREALRNLPPPAVR